MKQIITRSAALMMQQCRRRHGQIRNGQAGHVAIEFAFILPLLLAMVYGTVEVGHYNYIRLLTFYVAQQAVQQASVYNANNGSTAWVSSNVVTYMANTLISDGIASGTFTATGTTTSTVSITGATVVATYSGSDSPTFNGPGNFITVTVTATYTPLIPSLSSLPMIGTIVKNNNTIYQSSELVLSGAGS